MSEMEVMNHDNQNLVVSKENLIKTYGKVYKIDITITPDEDVTIEKTFYFVKPKTSSLDRYIKKAGIETLHASKVLINDNVVVEQQNEVNELLEEYPAAALSLSEKLLFILGLAKDVNFKKL